MNSSEHETHGLQHFYISHGEISVKVIWPLLASSCSLSTMTCLSHYLSAPMEVRSLVPIRSPFFVPLIVDLVLPSFNQTPYMAIGS
jgi:hypothetical protein